MELITSQIDKIEDLLAKMDETIDTARAVPFSGKISIEKEALYGIIDDIRAIVYEMRKGLPSEINQARRVLHDRDSHLNEARSRAEMIIKAAESEAHKILNEHELTLHAKQMARDIEEAAKKETKEFKISAAQYVDGIFKDLDDLLKTTLEDQERKAREVEDFYNSVLTELHHNRMSIRIDD